MNRIDPSGRGDLIEIGTLEDWNTLKTYVAYKAMGWEVRYNLCMDAVLLVVTSGDVSLEAAEAMLGGNLAEAGCVEFANSF